MTFGEELVLPDGTTPARRGPAPRARRRRRRSASTAASAPWLPRRPGRDGAGDRRRADHAQRRPAAAGRGPVRLRGGARLLRGAWSPRFVAAGARSIGGCCGTTPEHIAAMRAGARPLAPARAARADARRSPRLRAAPTVPAGVTADRRAPRRADAPAADRPARSAAPSGRFVISVEIDPPRSVRIERTIEAARLLQAAGVDVVNISDSAMARVRMGAMAVAFGIQHDLDLECVVHFTTRDRNLMALESELLGAHALGVREHPGADRRPAAGRRLPDRHRRLGRRLDRPHRDPGPAQPRRGRRPAARSARPAGFTIACALDPTAADAATEWDRLERKLDGGRPPDHDPAALRRSRRSRRCSPRRAAGSARAGSRCRCCSASCRCRARATRSSCTTRCPASPSRTRTRAAHARGRRPRRGGRPRDGARAARAGRRARRRHLRHAQLRALRAGRRAGPPAAGPPPGAGREPA